MNYFYYRKLLNCLFISSVKCILLFRIVKEEYFLATRFPPLFFFLIYDKRFPSNVALS